MPTKDKRSEKIGRDVHAQVMRQRKKVDQTKSQQAKSEPGMFASLFNFVNRMINAIADFFGMSWEPTSENKGGGLAENAEKVLDQQARKNSPLTKLGRAKKKVAKRTEQAVDNLGQSNDGINFKRIQAIFKQGAKKLRSKETGHNTPNDNNRPSLK